MVNYYFWIIHNSADMDTTQDNLGLIASELPGALTNSKNTQQFIYNTLSDFAARVKIGWEVEQFTKGGDNDVVRIGFNKVDATKTETSVMEMLPRHGGSLAFSMQSNGHIAVILSYGYMEDGEVKNHVRLHESIAPEHVTEQYLSKKIEVFLSECKPWECC